MASLFLNFTIAWRNILLKIQMSLNLSKTNVKIKIFARINWSVTTHFTEKR